ELECLLNTGLLLHGNNICTRNHRLFNPHIGELQDIMENLRIFLIEIFSAGVAQFFKNELYIFAIKYLISGHRIGLNQPDHDSGCCIGYDNKRPKQVITYLLRNSYNPYPPVSVNAKERFG